MARNRILELTGEATHILVSPNVADDGSVRGAQTAVSKLRLDLSSLVTLVQQNDGELTAHQRTGPDLEVTLGHVAVHLLVSSLVAPHTVTLHAQSVLVHGDGLLVAQNLQRLGRSLGQVAADQQRSLHQAPQGEVRLVLLEGHASVAHLQHIGVVPATRARAAPQLLVGHRDVDHAAPAVVNITGGSPAVAHRASPLSRIVHAPLAHGEEDVTAALSEGLGHHGVAVFRDGAVRVAVIVLQVVHLPLGVGLGIDGLEAEGARSSSASLESGIGVEAEEETLRVHVIGQSLHSRGEGVGIDHDLAVVGAAHLPAVVQVQVHVSKLVKACLDDRISGISRELLVDVASELVPGVETHLGLHSHALPNDSKPPQRTLLMARTAAIAQRRIMLFIHKDNLKRGSLTFPLLFRTIG